MKKEWIDVWDTPHEESKMSIKDKEVIIIFNDLEKELYYGSNFCQALMDATNEELDAIIKIISIARKRRGYK